jgi:glutamate 5-kinase
VVAIVDRNGQEFARGLTNYSAADARRIKGLRSEEILNLLGPRTYEEVIHRDNLVLAV